jgi:hypothetical protein
VVSASPKPPLQSLPVSHDSTNLDEGKAIRGRDDTQSLLTVLSATNGVTDREIPPQSGSAQNAEELRSAPESLSTAPIIQGSRLLSLATRSNKPSSTPGAELTPKLQPEDAQAFSPFKEQRQPQLPDLQHGQSLQSNDELASPGWQESEQLQNYPTAKGGSRFAKFFDGKPKDVLGPKPPVQAGFSSNPIPLNQPLGGSFGSNTQNQSDSRTMDDIFVMLNSSAQV